MGMKANQALNVNKQPLLVSLRYLQEVGKGTKPFYMHPIFIVGLFVVAIVAILYWAPLSALPAQTCICPGRRASTPTRTSCWG